MTFLYEPQLLNQLLVLAQQSEAQDQAKINNFALSVIQNLKNDLSSLKASRDPSFIDLESLDNFKKWAIESGAMAQGNLLIEKGNRFNKSVLNKFLVDLRDRFASDPDFSESIANLIDQTNKQLGTNIALYKAESPGVAPKQSPTPTNKSNTEKQEPVTNSGKENQSGEQKNQEQKPANENVKSAPRPNIIILDNRVIDFDEIYRGVWDIYRVAIKMMPDIGPLLNQWLLKINNTKSTFVSLTQKTPGLNPLAVSTDSGVMELVKNIETTFNGTVRADDGLYNGKELAQISSAFADLMRNVQSFYLTLQRIPQFSELSEIKNQIEWAGIYAKNFTNAAFQFRSIDQNARRVQ